MVKTLKKNKAQSTIEYILLVTAIVGIIVAFHQNIFRSRVNDTIDEATKAMVNQAERLGAARK